jgi:CRISPR type I-E-associated protein CasB/Cse2
MTNPSINHDAFLQRIENALQDRGKSAALRKYWSAATRHHSYPILGLLGALEDPRKAILIALYAQHPQHKDGMTVGKAALALGERKDGEHPFDRHFRRLLACEELGTVADPGDLAQQLHRFLQRLSSNGIPIDYRELQKNLNFWGKWTDAVKLRWAADFWQAPQLNETPSQP